MPQTFWSTAAYKQRKSTMATTSRNRKWSADATAELNRLSLQESDWNLGGGGILEHQTRGKRVQLCPLLTAPINRRITDSDEDSCTEVLNGSGDRKMTNGKW